MSVKSEKIAYRPRAHPPGAWAPLGAACKNRAKLFDSPRHGITAARQKKDLDILFFIFQKMVPYRHIDSIGNKTNKKGVKKWKK